MDLKIKRSEFELLKVEAMREHLFDLRPGLRAGNTRRPRGWCLGQFDLLQAADSIAAVELALIAAKAKEMLSDAEGAASNVLADNDAKLRRLEDTTAELAADDEQLTKQKEEIAEIVRVNPPTPRGYTFAEGDQNRPLSSLQEHLLRQLAKHIEVVQVAPASREDRKLVTQGIRALQVTGILVDPEVGEFVKRAASAVRQARRSPGLPAEAP